MSKDHTKTVRIRKVDKVAPDHRGRSVWLGKIEPVELELVSTTALEKILKTEGGKTRSEIQKLAAGRKNGVLARDTATGHFRILCEPTSGRRPRAPPGDGPKRSGVVTAAPLTETTRKKADELSLVSTQILRKVVKPDGRAGNEKPKAAARKDKFGGFNPYDNNWTGDAHLGVTLAVAAAPLLHPAREVLGRQRLRVVESLRVVATHVGEPGRDLGALDALRDHLEPERVAERHDLLDDARVGLVGEHVHDE